MHLSPRALYNPVVWEKRPYFKQAAFSIWENKAAMSNFAYHQQGACSGG